MQCVKNWSWSREKISISNQSNRSFPFDCCVLENMSHATDRPVKTREGPIGYLYFDKIDDDKTLLSIPMPHLSSFWYSVDTFFTLILQPYFDLLSWSRIAFLLLLVTELFRAYDVHVFALHTTAGFRPFVGFLLWLQRGSCGGGIDRGALA